MTLGLSQKEWLADAALLKPRLGVILGVLNNAINQLNDTGMLFPLEAHGTRQTYLLLSSCKLFCLTAQARIYMETSKLPILPQDQMDHFRGLAVQSIGAFFDIHKTFDQEGDLRHLDYFVIVRRSNRFSTLNFPMSLTVPTALLVSYSRPLPGRSPGRRRWVPARGGPSTNYHVGERVESYARGQGRLCSPFHGRFGRRKSATR